MTLCIICKWPPVLVINLHHLVYAGSYMLIQYKRLVWILFMQKMSGIWLLTITQIDIFLIFTPANPDHIYHFTEDLGGRKLWYNPDPLLLWGNGILRTLALASGSTSFLRLNADHHIQQGIDFLLHQSLSKLIPCNGFYYTIWWYYKLISLYRTPLINTLSTALPGPILAEIRCGL